MATTGNGDLSADDLADLGLPPNADLHADRPENWGPCAEDVQNYTSPLIFGELTSRLHENREASEVIERYRQQLEKIFSSWCPSEASDAKCNENLKPMIEELYPIHRSLAMELMTKGLIKD